MKYVLHALVWLPALTFTAFWFGVLCAFIFGGMYVSPDLFNRAMLAFTVDIMLVPLALFLSLEVIE